MLDGRTGALKRRLPMPVPFGVVAIDPARAALYGIATLVPRRASLAAVGTADGRLLATSEIGDDAGVMLAADPTPHALYAVVSFRDDSFLARYDATTLARQSWVDAGYVNFGLAVDGTAHRAYVAALNGVLACAGPAVDPATCGFRQYALGGMPVGVAVDEATHVVYIAVSRTGDPLSQYIAAVDPAAETVLTTLAVPSRQVGGAGISAIEMAVDPASHTLYMANGDAVTVIAGLGNGSAEAPSIPALPRTGGGWRGARLRG